MGILFFVFGYNFSYASFFKKDYLNNAQPRGMLRPDFADAYNLAPQGGLAKLGLGNNSKKIRVAEVNSFIY
jgi:hypothetical protein